MDISDIFHFACYYKQGTYAYSFTCLQVHMSSISSACILLACRDFHVPLYYLTRIYFESSFNSFHSQIYCMRLPTAPHFYQHKIQIFFNSYQSDKCKWFLNAISLCIFMINNEVKYLLFCLLASHAPFNMKCMFKSFVHLQQYLAFTYKLVECLCILQILILYRFQILIYIVVTTFFSVMIYFHFIMSINKQIIFVKSNLPLWFANSVFSLRNLS